MAQPIHTDAGRGSTLHLSRSRARRGHPLLWVLLPPALVVAALIVAALLLSGASIAPDGAALARMKLPLTGGTVQSVRVTGPHGRAIPVTVRDGRLWPRVALTPGEPLSVALVVRRAGWISWLAGERVTAHLQMHAPVARLRERYLILGAAAPLRLQFSAPVRMVAYGRGEALHRRVLGAASSEVTLRAPSQAGSLLVAAAPRTWERMTAPAVVSWFPAGSGPSAVASPLPGSRLTPTTPIVLTFSEPVSAVPGGSRPHISPAVAGRWSSVDSHTIEFRPSGYGYGFGAHVTVALPRGVRLVSGAGSSPGGSASWTVPDGSILRAQQLLAKLGYLPLRFTPVGPPVARTLAAQERAAVEPPAGRFSWRYGNVPSSLRALWSAGGENVVSRGALMAFEEAHGLTPDGSAGPQVWRALIRDAVAGGPPASGGYTYVMVSESSQSLDLWHDGHTVLTTPVNTGIASAPTAKGTFPVFEHISSGTMSGTNPDGSHYNDPGVPWISYFNGGDALHGFTRAQYGFPQSLGCVEMPVSAAGRVWPYTPVGTLVHVA